MKTMSAVLAAIALLCLCGTAQATVIIDWTPPVGDPGNNADITGYGAVDHSYSIGVNEVNVGQWVEFLNWKEWGASSPVLFNALSENHITRTGSGTIADPYSYVVDPIDAGDPALQVSFWDACRFVNWLNNGQGNGDTETGAYTLGGYDGSAGGDITRNAGATYVIPTIDEWYKAAYYAGDGTYFTDPTAASAYGTVGQFGNGWEWTETSVDLGDRVLGGGYDTIDFKGTSLGDPSHVLPKQKPIPTNMGSGFRLAQVPEPSSILALAGGLMLLLGTKRRRA